MKTILLSVPISPNYKNDYIELSEKEYQLRFDIQDGSHDVKSDPIEIGKLKHSTDKIIIAQLSFSYHFDQKNNILTLFGSDFEDEKSISLITYLKGTSEYCIQKVNTCSVATKGGKFNPNWNYTTYVTPNLEANFAEITKNANDQLIKAAKNIKDVIVHVKTLPPKLSAEEHKNLLLVYKDGSFLELQQPNKTYDEHHTVRTIESVWGGTVHFNYGENFANVIGSTNDPKIAGQSWIGLWRNQFGNPNACTSLNYGGFPCTNYLVGGHVVLGQQASYVPPGSNAVYIMPICQAHNSNDNVYMAALHYLNGIWLKNYMN